MLELEDRHVDIAVAKDGELGVRVALHLGEAEGVDIEVGADPWVVGGNADVLYPGHGGFSYGVNVAEERVGQGTANEREWGVKDSRRGRVLR